MRIVAEMSVNMVVLTKQSVRSWKQKQAAGVKLKLITSDHQLVTPHPDEEQQKEQRRQQKQTLHDSESPLDLWENQR